MSIWQAAWTRAWRAALKRWNWPTTILYIKHKKANLKQGCSKLVGKKRKAPAGGVGGKRERSAGAQLPRRAGTGAAVCPCPPAAERGCPAPRPPGAVCTARGCPGPGPAWGHRGGRAGPGFGGVFPWRKRSGAGSCRGTAPPTLPCRHGWPGGS